MDPTTQRRWSRKPSMDPTDFAEAEKIAVETQGGIGQLLRNVQKGIQQEVEIGPDFCSGQHVGKQEALGSLFILLQKDKTVKKVKIENVDMGRHWLLKIVAEAISLNTSIKNLTMNGTDIGPEGASILASSLSQNRSLRTLILRANNIGDSGVNELVESLIHNSTIAELSLERNVLSDQGLIYVSRLLENRSVIKTLLLGGNMISFDNVKYVNPAEETMETATTAFCAALENNDSLCHLSFSDNEAKLGYEFAPVLDTLKTCKQMRLLSLSNCLLSNRLVLSLAEFCIATKQQNRHLELAETGLEARHLRETCVFRFVKHDNTVRGVDYTGVSDSEELTAQITFLVHILSRDGQPVFPNSKQETFMLLDGRVVTLQLDEDGCIKEGEIFYSHGDSLQFAPPSKPQKRLVIEEEFGRSFSGDTSKMVLEGTYTMFVPSGVDPVKIFALGTTAINVADYIFDLVVLAQLGIERDWNTFFFLLGITIWAVGYVCYSLWCNGRKLAAALHPFSLAIVLDAFNFLVRKRVPSATIPINTSQPMQGLPSIQRLKLIEALLESAPQVLLQCFVALRGDRDAVLLVSIGLSFISIVGSVAQSDRHKIRAWAKSLNKTWISTLSFSLIFVALFRALEVASNMATISLAMLSLPFNIGLTLGIILGGKLLLTIIYWKFNLTHLGEVLSSILVSPGTERMTYDWVKAVPRLSTWYYVAIQVLFDLGILVSLVLIPGSTVGEGQDEELYFLSIGIVTAKYLLAVVLYLLHNYAEFWLYSDRRRILTCGFLKKKADEADKIVYTPDGRTSIMVSASARNLLQSKLGIEAKDDNNNHEHRVQIFKNPLQKP